MEALRAEYTNIKNKSSTSADTHAKYLNRLASLNMKLNYFKRAIFYLTELENLYSKFYPGSGRHNHTLCLIARNQHKVEKERSDWLKEKRNRKAKQNEAEKKNKMMQEAKNK
tara:strand:+ start:1455 stop:1790 length:336 start_codon:yes stop_codon:yes gene_type:complete